jgi:transketolase
MRTAFINTLIDIASKDKNVHIITGDLGYGVLNPFFEQFPDQYTNIGIDEQTMTGFAAGMALEGKTVFTYSIGNFPTLRCLEQIRVDCAYNNSNVKIVCIGGGFAYGSLGMTHHATEDLAIMRALPNVTVLAPGDLVEAECATRAIYNQKGTCYLRLGRGGETRIHDKIDNFQIGKANKIIDGDKVAIFSTGAILDEALKAANELNDMGISTALVSFTTVKPIDKDTILAYANKCDIIVTIEEHNISGGFGGAVAEVMAENPSNARLIRVGINDRYSSIVGTQQYLRDYYEINAKKVLELVAEAMGKNHIFKNHIST